MTMMMKKMTKTMKMTQKRTTKKKVLLVTNLVVVETFKTVERKEIREKRNGIDIKRIM